MKEIAFTVFPVRVVTATQDCSYIDPVHGLQHADNRDRITVDNGSAVGFVYYSGAYPDAEDIDAIKSILRTMREIVKEEREACANLCADEAQKARAAGGPRSVGLAEMGDHLAAAIHAHGAG